MVYINISHSCLDIYIKSFIFSFNSYMYLVILVVIRICLELNPGEALKYLVWLLHVLKYLDLLLGVRKYIQ